jgi:hypothetical protein
MKTNLAFRLSKSILLSFLITVLMTTGLGGVKSVKGLANGTTYQVPGDFSKIQDCLNVANPGDTCVVSSGTYNESLVIKRSGTKDEPIHLITNGTVTINSGNSRTLFTQGNVHDWVIDGFRFTSTLVDNSHPSKIGTVNFSYNYWGSGYKGESGNDRFILRNCYIEGAVYIYGSDNLVENCELNGLDRFSQGLIEAYQPSENNVFRNNIIHDYTKRGGWSLQFTENTLWEGNTVYNTGLMGIDCDGAGNPVHKCNLIGNTIYNIDGLGVELENCFDCTMRGNSIRDARDALSVINYGDGPDFHTEGSVEYRDDPIGGVIENNIFENTNLSGMICRGAPGGKFRNNTVRNIAAAPGYWGGVALSNYGGFPCTSWEITGNQFQNNRYDWFVQAPVGFSLTADFNNYDSFSAQWDDGFRNFSQWQVMGYDTQELPTPTLVVVTNSPPATSVVNPGPLPGLAWEAEQGQIFPPFTTGNGSISQDVLTINPVDGGRALYRFSIQETGEYIVKATVNAADASSNSFFVGMDTEPDTSMIWDVPITVGFEERTVSWRGGISPDGSGSTNKVFNLVPGEHSLIIRGREAGTLLDKVEVAKAPIALPTATATVITLPTETPTPIPTQTYTTTPSPTPTTEVASGPIYQPTITATATQIPTSVPTFTSIPTLVITEPATPTPIVFTDTPEPTSMLTETAPPTFTPQEIDTIPPKIINVEIVGTDGKDINTSNEIRSLITFSEDVGASGSNIANFSLNGANNGPVVIDSINYDNNTLTTTLSVYNESPLPPDNYTLKIMGTASIEDLAGNKLDGNGDGTGGDDFVYSFSVQSPTTDLPTETQIPPIATATVTSIPASPTPTATYIPPTETATETPIPPSPTPTETPIPPTPTAEPTTPPVETTYDDTNIAFAYSNGWETIYDWKAYGGTFKQTRYNGSSVTLNFTGQSFSILYKTGRNYRVMNVYVDGKFVEAIDEQDFWQGFLRRWDYPGLLDPGTHTLKLIYDGSKGGRTRRKGSLDAVIVR